MKTRTKNQLLATTFLCYALAALLLYSCAQPVYKGSTVPSRPEGIPAISPAAGDNLTSIHAVWDWFKGLWVTAHAPGTPAQVTTAVEAGAPMVAAATRNAEKVSQAAATTDAGAVEHAKYEATMEAAHKADAKTISDQNGTIATLKKENEDKAVAEIHHILEAVMALASLAIILGAVLIYRGSILPGALTAGGGALTFCMAVWAIMHLALLGIIGAVACGILLVGGAIALVIHFHAAGTDLSVLWHSARTLAKEVPNGVLAEDAVKKLVDGTLGGEALKMLNLNTPKAADTK